MYLDGELYKHGRSLQWISGQGRRGEGGDVEYHVYDAFWPAEPTLPARERLERLDRFFAAAPPDATDVVVRVPGVRVASEAEIRALADQYVAEGYEGAIARRLGRAYEYGANGRHSTALLKYKPRHDAEFPLVGFSAAEKGAHAGAVIWACRAGEGAGAAEFTVVPSMPTADRKRLFRLLQRPAADVYAARGEVAPAEDASRTVFEAFFRGAPLTVEYAELSDGGLPLQPKALAFRTYEGRDDRVARALGVLDQLEK